MLESEPRTHLAEVVCNEVLPRMPGEPVIHRMVLWAPTVQKHFEFSVYSVPLDEEPYPLEQEFPLGSKVLLTEDGERLIQVKRLVSSQQAKP